MITNLNQLFLLYISIEKELEHRERKKSVRETSVTANKSAIRLDSNPSDNGCSEFGISVLLLRLAFGRRGSRLLSPASLTGFEHSTLNTCRKSHESREETKPLRPVCIRQFFCANYSSSFQECFLFVFECLHSRTTPTLTCCSVSTGKKCVCSCACVRVRV